MSERPSSRLSRRWKIVIASVGLAGAVGAGGIYWFLSGDPPPPVDIETIADRASTTFTTTKSDTEATLPADPDEAPLGSPEGSWTVDTSVGEFSVTEETAASFVGFRVDEVLRGIGSIGVVSRGSRHHRVPAVVLAHPLMGCAKRVAKGSGFGLPQAET